MWRLQTSGLIDSTFGVSGLSLAQSTSFSSARGIAVHPVDSSIIQYGPGGNTGRFPSLFYNDPNGHAIGGCSNDTFEVMNLGYRFGHYFTNAVYDPLNNLRFFGLTGQKEIAGSGPENSNYLRISNECLNVVDSVREFACSSYTSPSGKIWESSGIYLDTLPNPNQCNLDSVLIVDLEINQFDTSVTQVAETLTSNEINVNYQWLDCFNGYAIIPGETNQTFTYSFEGSYAVQIDSIGCVDTSGCHFINLLGIEDQISRNEIKIYPNPANEIVRIDLRQITLDIQISILDFTGKEVYQYLQSKGQLVTIRPQLKSGIYMMNIRTSKGNDWRKLIIE